MSPMEDIFLGDIVRLYEEDEWFFEGKIIEVTSATVYVDFGDWVQQYEKKNLSQTLEYCTCQKYFYPVNEGIVIEDYRNIYFDKQAVILAA